MGFFLGILFMYSVKVLCEDMEGEQEEEDDSSSDDEAPEAKTLEFGAMKYASIATGDATLCSLCTLTMKYASITTGDTALYSFFTLYASCN